MEKRKKRYDEDFKKMIVELYNKKSNCHIHAKIEDKIKFIEQHENVFNVCLLCNCLGIHHSVYYYHLTHQSNS